MKVFIWWLGILGLAAPAAGCGMGSYATVDLPYCVSDEPGKSSAPEKSFTVIRKQRGGWSMEPLQQGFGGPRVLSPIGAKRTILAVVACTGEREKALDAEAFMKEFSDTHVPSLCSGQEVVIHAVLKAEKDARAEALGYDGLYRFPRIDLGCVDGRTVQDNLRTLGQILGDFAMSVQAFMEEHGRPPAGFDELEKATLANPLPPDPWGHPLKFEVSGNAVRLLSFGPDGKEDTDDDEEACSVKQGQITHILTFKGVDLDYDADYKAYVKTRGPADQAAGEAAAGKAVAGDAPVGAAQSSSSWDSAFGGLQDDKSYDLRVTSDGGLVVAGATASKGAGDHDAWVFKLDGGGRVVWDRAYGGDKNDEAYAIAAAAGGGFVVAGTTESSGAGGRDGWMFRIDDQGKLLWERTFGGPYWDELRSVQETADGGFVAAGYTEPAGAGAHFAFVVRTDKAGAPLWEQTLNRSQWDDAQAVVEKSGGGFAAAGYTEAEGTSLAHDALLAGLTDEGKPAPVAQAPR